MLFRSVMSFSYRHGVPQHADLVLDARFLQNPHYIAALRPHTGQDADVGEYIRQDSKFNPFMQGVTTMIGAMLPGLRDNNRAYFTIAFGCTGGKHRSVYLAETIGQWLNDSGQPAQVSHRELEKNGMLKPSAIHPRIAQ